MIRRDILSPDGSLYLTRWYLWGKPQPADGSWTRTGPELYLHRIAKSDDPTRGLHNHPWRWAVSLILWGGYVEWSNRHELGLKLFGPLSINVIRDTDFHRIELVDGRPCWTLFLVGPRVKGWGFLKDGFFKARRP